MTAGTITLSLIVALLAALLLGFFLLRSPRRWVLLEWGLITVAVSLFCAAFLDLGKPTRLPGNEAEVFQTLDWTLVRSLSEYRTFPLWNPYLHTGLPFVADPMLHVYNPVATIPVLLFGVRDGYKIGIFLSFLIAAFGMWRLASALGMDRAARLWAALMYAFAGQPIARFFQGEYLFVYGFAWIPWILVSLILALKTGRRLYIASSALTLALLFFSGNAYYAFLMSFVVALFALVAVLSLQRVKPYLSLDFRRIRVLGAIGLLALGLAAIQLLPLIQMWPRLDKGLGAYGAHTPQQIYLDYTSKDTLRPDAYNVLPAREEFYAYIGVWPFAALILLPLAIWKRDRKVLLFLALMLILMVLYIDLNQMPWREAYLRTNFLTQFRHLLRPLILGSFALILLAAFGMDTLWKMLQPLVQTSIGTGVAKLRFYLAQLGLVLVIAWMLAGVLDLYNTNHQYVQTQAVDPVAYQVMGWLRKFDLSDYYVRHNPNNGWHDAILSVGLRFMDAWYPFTDIRRFENNISQRTIQAQPHYIVQSPSEPAPDQPGATILEQVEGTNIFRLPESLPYSFTAQDAELSKGPEAGELQRKDVVPLTSFSPGPNSVETIASSEQAGIDQAGKLVVLISHYPGWQVSIDGRPQALLNAGGYLATELQPGIHKYVFSFRPRPFYIGLLVSLIALGICLYLAWSDLQIEWREALARLRGSPEWVRSLGRQLRDRVYAGRLVTQAVYREGSLHPEGPLGLEEEAGVRLTLEPDATQLSQNQTAWRHWLWSSADLAGALLRAIPLAGVLFAGALIVYVITRLYALERFPIYFFGDEAVQVLFAQDLIARHFHGPDGTLLPIYVEAAGNRWTPLISMYFHALSMTLFGKSIVVSRATSAVVSLLGAGAVGLILHRVFKARFAWVGILLVAVTPAWFLHSRTAFETVMTTAFYACFLLFYMLYRSESPRYLYAAVVFGAATFYSYSNAQAIILAAAALLLISDFRYHLQNRDTVLRGLLLAAVLAIPFFEFRLSRPQALSEHLRVVGSYWYQAIPIQEKLLIFAQKYLYGLSPLYWFFPNAFDLPRHRMAGFGQMQTAILPFFLLGLAVCLAKWRSSTHRAVILAVLATPAGAALVDIGIARVLAFIVPANLLAALGLEWLLERWKERLPYHLAAIVLFAGLVWANFAMLNIALVKGPLWFRDYGLYGMQYGARQLFEEAIPEFLAKEPDTQILVSSTWANGADNFLRFFFTQQELKRVRMDGVASYLFKKLPLNDRMIFIMTEAEYQQARGSPKFGSVDVEKIIPYPDGTPGFYFARLQYSPNVDAVFAAEAQARQQLVSSSVMIDGQTVELHYSRIDMGTPDQMFDNDSFTLMRGLEANPFVLEFSFPEPRHVSGVTADFGLVNLTLTAKLYASPDGPPAMYNATFLSTITGNPQVEMRFPDAPEKVSKFRLEILNILSGETANIHIREIRLLP